MKSALLALLLFLGKLVRQRGASSPHVHEICIRTRAVSLDDGKEHENFLRHEEAVAVEVELFEFFNWPAGAAPLVHGDLAVLVRVELRKPCGQSSGQFAGGDHGWLA